MSIVFVAPNPLFNLTIMEGNWVVRQLAAQGFPGAVLYVNPVAPAGTNAGGLETLAAFQKANPEFTTNQPVYLQVAVPNKPDYYTAGLVAFDLGYGIPAAQALQ